MSIDVRAKLEDDHVKKFDELQAFLKKRTNNQKYGNANTLRLAIELAHDKMEELQKEEENTIENYKKFKRQLDNKIDDL